MYQLFNDLILVTFLSCTVICKLHSLELACLRFFKTKLQFAQQIFLLTLITKSLRNNKNLFEENFMQN